MRALPRRARAVVLLSALSLYLTAGRGVSSGDESWFLLVATRVVDGDHLYRDVFYSPLPMAVYVTAAPVALFGTHIAIVEILNALTWAGTACVLIAHTRRATGSRTIAVLAIMALVVVAPPQRNSLYTPLAMLPLLACMLISTRLVQRGGDRLALLAGVAAGLSFTSKQTVGAGALAALLTCIALAPRARSRRAVVAALGGFAVMSAATALPLMLSGELAAAIRLGFIGKGEYLANGSLSYSHALWSAVRYVGSQPTGAFDNLPSLLGPLVAVVLVVAAGRRALSSTVLVPAAFAIAALAAAYPRMSATHVAWANPAVIACAASAVGRSLRRPRRLIVALAIPLAAGCGIAASLPLLSWAEGRLVFSSLPAFRGMPIERTSEDEARTMIRAVRPGEVVFFVTETAGFFYLTTGARNPTRYDVPASSNIGPHEIASIVAGVRDGRITRACFGGRLAYHEEPSLRPYALEHVLQREMRAAANLGPCVLHVRAPRLPTVRQPRTAHALPPTRVTKSD